MAATRLIAMHVNKGKTAAACLKARIDYAENPEKTNGGEYIRSYECDPRMAAEEFLLSKQEYLRITGRQYPGDIIAYQIRQSFKPGEVTADDANRIGYETAIRFTKGNHAFIVCTHTDRAHIHNHIIFNSTTLDCTRKFRDFFLCGRALQQVSDIICLENHLSVIRPAPYAERKKRQIYDRPQTHRGEVRAVVDMIIRKKPKDMEAVYIAFENAGYQCRRGRHFAVKRERWDRYIRLDSLGVGYTESDIRAILEGTYTVPDIESFPRESADAVSSYQSENPDAASRSRKNDPAAMAHTWRQRPDTAFNLLIDIEAKMKEGKGKGYEQWAKTFNVKQMAKVLNFLQEHNITDYKDLVRLSDGAAEQFDELSGRIRSSEKRLQELSAMRRHIIDYVRTRDVYQEYRKSGYSRKFHEEHEDEIRIHQEAKRAFDHLGRGKLPTLKEINEEYQQVLQEKRDAYANYRELRDNMKNYSIARKNVEIILGYEDSDERNHNRQR